MLLEFAVGNYRSFNNIQTLSFLATGLVSEDKEIDQRNIVDVNGSPVLKTVAIYGPNGSGKSNVIKGLSLFRQLVTSSLEAEGIMDFAPEPFRLTKQDIAHSGFFQMVLEVSKRKFRYGFTLSKAGTVLQEWLFGPAEKNETWYFKRTRDGIVCNKDWFQEGFKLPLEKLRPDTLFLTFVSAYDGPVSQSIRSYISSSITVEDLDLRSGVADNRPMRQFRNPRNLLTNRLLKEGKSDLVLDWLKNAGLTYSNILLDTVGGAAPQELVVLLKNIYDDGGQILDQTAMLLNGDESAGTQKFYSYIGWLYEKFQQGGVFISDEIDNNFHPSLLQQLVRFFNDPQINIAGAQLLFTSHDTTLLQPDILRRDQIYFTEKSSFDETILYSLSDLKGIRNNADFARQYLAGFYGALPILGNYTD